MPLPTDAQTELIQTNIDSSEYKLNEGFSFGISNIITFCTLVLIFSFIFIIVSYRQMKNERKFKTLKQLEEEYIQQYYLMSN